ncbi:MAG: sulfur carrier protein ThiS [Muribaculaceae bacterium]|nr:sulfur carrier protein ThiS [Muribaculaceae bacterium]
MKIILNGKEYFPACDTLTVAGLIDINRMPSTGIAVALNNRIVRKSDWDDTRLADGDHVTIITAVCGG